MPDEPYLDDLRTWHMIAVVFAVIFVGMVWHQRAPQTETPTAVGRAAVLLYLLSIVLGTYGAIHDWPGAVRLTPPVVLAFLAGAAAIFDLRDEYRKKPVTGPLGAVRRLVDQFKRRRAR